MKKVATILIFILLFALFLLGGVGFGASQTSFSGVISTDTTWTRTQNPITLTGNVLVNEGVTLTISPGVTVNLGDYYIMVNGTLLSRGTSSDKIAFIGGAINYPTGLSLTSSANGWNEQTGAGCIMENTVLNTTVTISCNAKIVGNTANRYMDIDEASPLITDNTLGSLTIRGSPTVARNTIAGSIHVASGAPAVTHNTIKASPGRDWIGRINYYPSAVSISGDSPLISDNVIITNVEQSAIIIGGGTPTIQNNVISNDYGYGSASFYHQSALDLNGASNATIKSNTIINSPVGISCHTSTFTLENNNFQGNTYNLYLYSKVTSDVNVPNNWWGTTNTTVIDQKFYDYNDDFSLRKINYTPFLTSPNPEAPQPPQPTPTPTPNVTPTPNPTENPTTSPTNTLNPTQSPNPTKSGSNNITELRIDWGQIALFTLLTVIAVALCSIAVLLYKRNKLQKAALTRTNQ